MLCYREFRVIENFNTLILCCREFRFIHHNFSYIIHQRVYNTFNDTNNLINFLLRSHHFSHFGICKLNCNLYLVKKQILEKLLYIFLTTPDDVEKYVEMMQSSSFDN